MYSLYTDNSILVGPEQEEIDHIIEDLRRYKLILTIERDPQESLGVDI